MKQDATSITRIAEGPNGPTETKYVLDGASHDGAQPGSKYTAKVDGSTIVIETSRDMNGTAVTSKQVWSMDGGELLIASTQPGRNGGEPTTRKTYYKKG